LIECQRPKTGWVFRGFAADTDYGTNHISNTLNPGGLHKLFAVDNSITILFAGAKELQRLSERHTYHLIQYFVEPRIDVPVLLLRAGVRDTSDTEFYVAENGDDELNFFTRENNPLLEIHTVPGAEHADLVGYASNLLPTRLDIPHIRTRYRDNFATPVVQEIAEHIRRWCRSLD
jgi:hypothetical protein